MSPTRRLIALDLMIAGAIAVEWYWLVVLWPFLTGTGPAPGAGAQYVFILLPTVAMSTVMLALSVPLQVIGLKEAPPPTRRWPHYPFSILGALVLVALTLWWARFFLRWVRDVQ